MNNATGFGPVLGTDSLGRVLVTSKEAGAIKTDKKRQVGMFYFVWCGTDSGHRHEPAIPELILKEHPEAAFDEKHPAWTNKTGEYYHWGEPFYGFYFSNDEWVIRKHMEMLTLAGIDFLFFDTTNANYYERTTRLVMKVLHEFNEQGWNAPKVMYYTNTKSGQTIQGIYENIYKKNVYPDTWFYVDGKPAIIGRPNDCSDEVKEFFSVQQAQWPAFEPDLEGGWPWMDFRRPQKKYERADGTHSVVNVAVAQHPQLWMGDSLMYGEKGNWGRSFHHGVHEQDNDPNAILYGYNVAEEWEVARELDPDYVLVTGWNEWIAGKWDRPEPRQGNRVCNFVDLASPEYSRDMDLMRGGYFDNYYMQLISDVRKYKGCEEIPVHTAKTVEINKDFHQWDNVEISYRNFDGAINRCAEGYGSKIYTNYTMRNNIVESKVCADSENVYFYVRASRTITPEFSEGSWMNLFIKANGKDFVANRKVIDRNTTTLVCGEFDGETVGEISYVCENDQMHLAIPRKMLGLDQGSFEFMFKWGDSTEKFTSVEDFYENGSVAPLGRVYYPFKSE